MADSGSHVGARDCKGRAITFMPYNILVVDDDINNAHMIEKVIEKDGHYKAKLASSGQEAIDLITSGATQDIDLVLLDMHMPGVDGFEVIKAIKPVKPDMPIIIRSGQDDISMVAKAMKAGATDFIRKLENTEKLRECIDSAIREHVLHEGIADINKAKGGLSSFNDILAQALNEE